METVERRWYANRNPAARGCDTDRPTGTTKRDLLRSDRLRLDVAVGSSDEIFSWHGQKRFQTDEIDQLVTTGPISSGTYFSFLSSIFLERIARIDYSGVRADAGRQLAVFGYSVPISQSNFETRTESGKRPMGYHGEFTVNPGTAQLTALQIVTDDMPPSSTVCSFSLRAAYTDVTLNGIALQLPSDVLMDVVDLNRQHVQTDTHYGQCHEFRGESALLFGTAATTPASPSAPAPQTLPAGTRLQIKITTAIHPNTASAGDPISGVLLNDIVEGDGTVLIPKHTPVDGRLLRFETWYKPSRFYTAALEFRSLNFAARDYVLKLKPVRPLAPGSESHALRPRIPLDNPAFANGSALYSFRLGVPEATLKGLVTYWLTQ